MFDLRPKRKRLKPLFGTRSEARVLEPITKVFRSALSKVVENPLQYQIVDEDMRRAPVGNYPHGLLYAASDDEIIILSGLHGSRDPAIWRKRR